MVQLRHHRRFLAWFGGTGYLLAHYYGVWFVVALGVAIVERPRRRGDRVLVPGQGADAREEALDPADYDMVGVLGKLSMPIRAGGTGEIDLYAGGHAPRLRRAQPKTGAAIPKGAEVVVTRYEKGIAYVRAWEELAGDVEQTEPNRRCRHVWTTRCL